MNIIYAFASVVLVSLLSLSGAVLLVLTRKRYEKILFFLVSFAVGALFGDAFIHLIPEAFDTLKSGQVPLLIIAGILTFFILEKFVRWHHCHLNEGECESHSHHVGTMNIVGDGVHNFLDGILIAASYLVNIPLGVATTAAIILHEIPSEIGEFGVLLHSGMKVKKAVLYNLLSAFMAILGVALVIGAGKSFENLATYLVPVAAGGFIYIGGSDLIPELHHETGFKKSLIQFVAIVLGVVIMLGLGIFE